MKEITHRLVDCPKSTRVIIHVRGLDDPRVPPVWNLDELTRVLIRTGVVGELVFRADGRWDGKGRGLFNVVVNLTTMA